MCELRNRDTGVRSAILLDCRPWHRLRLLGERKSHQESMRVDESHRCARKRRPLGVRLRFADVASRLRLSRARAGAAHRLAPGAVRLFVRPSRHAGAAGARARARSRRHVPRHRLPRRRRGARQNVAYLRAREQVTTVYLETMRRIELKRKRGGRCARCASSSTAATRNMPGGSRSRECVHHVRQGHGRSGPNRDYVLETVQALEALGYRETDLHLIAERLKGQQSVVGHSIAFASCDQAAPSLPRSRLAAGEEYVRLSSPGRNRIEDFDKHRPGRAAQRTARPEQPGIERYRYAGKPGLGIEDRRCRADSAARRPAPAACPPERSRSGGRTCDLLARRSGHPRQRGTHVRRD